MDEKQQQSFDTMVSQMEEVKVTPTPSSERTPTGELGEAEPKETADQGRDWKMTITSSIEKVAEQSQKLHKLLELVLKKSDKHHEIVEWVISSIEISNFNASARTKNHFVQSHDQPVQPLQTEEGVIPDKLQAPLLTSNVIKSLSESDVKEILLAYGLEDATGNPEALLMFFDVGGGRLPLW
ncbi:hypothetical protein M426DRAFT_320079 [Hypoxylon sp. CI-4A]|nr:hypothetical protein M426DRAFT_320079 [Hypoxylon sp. CI-4A]